MTSEQFTYWLQGFAEIQQGDSITDAQWLVIKDHLKLVFDKKTPGRTKLSDWPAPGLIRWPGQLHIDPVVTC